MEIEHMIHKPRRATKITVFLTAVSVMWMFAFSISSAQDAPVNSKLNDTILACFMPPPGATHIAVISATFAEDGSFKEKPKIVESGEGSIDAAFAAAALRAVMRCEPRIAEFHLKGVVSFRFDPSSMSLGTQTTDIPDVPSPARLQAMATAADQLRDIVKKRRQSGQSISPTQPEIAPLLSVLCAPQEAERLKNASLKQYELVSQYARHVNTVMAVYEAETERGPQALITERTRQLGACFDATLWTGTVTLSMFETFFSATPALSNSPEWIVTRKTFHKSLFTATEGVLDGYRLDGIGSDWCLARIRPLDAMTRELIPTMPAEQKKRLRQSLRLAAKCGPKVQEQLQPIAKTIER
ncbi:hypothetical protein BJF95_15290 [Rhizobium oryziradicis]|uniref:TonB C-terminal domain-containing protein n=2 Tax=Rhizobium oryziradicis TaxID=1867956 RepID=A0A1Q8ZXB2_9HYPH|nr:hypothetical protein BJF95_15290 [Rhizobium oryziradicis]